MKPDLPEQRIQKYFDEEPDGFLYRYTSLLAGRVRADVWQRLCDHRNL